MGEEQISVLPPPIKASRPTEKLIEIESVGKKSFLKIQKVFLGIFSNFFLIFLHNFMYLTVKRHSYLKECLESLKAYNFNKTKK